MGDGPPGWMLTALRGVDDKLKGMNKKLKRTLGIIRALAAFLILLELAIIAGAVLVYFRPEYIPIVLSLVVVGLMIPLVAVTALVMFPLRMKSVTRLIDKGYPANARELAIRVAARKMRDESIETEELLVETAWNESKKALKKYRNRAQQVREDLQDDEKQPDVDVKPTETPKP